MTVGLTEEWQQFLADSDSDIEAELEDGTKPQHWIEQGFNPVEAHAWQNVDAFDPIRVRELTKLGFSHDQVGRRLTEQENQEYGFRSGHTIAYLWCNDNLSVEHLRKLVTNNDRP